MANADDREFYELFSAFDDVSASDELKTQAIDAILAQGETQQNSSQPEEDVRPVSASSSSHIKAGRKARWRAFRIAALAACLALALTGGVAWATPASYVEIAQDDTTIELGINCFGVTVAASSDDELGNDVIQSEELVNIPRNQSIERTVDSLEKSRPDLPIQVDGQQMPHPNSEEPPAPSGESDETPQNPNLENADSQMEDAMPAAYGDLADGDQAEVKAPPENEGSDENRNTAEPAAPESEGGERQPEGPGPQDRENGFDSGTAPQPNNP